MKNSRVQSEDTKPLSEESEPPSRMKRLAKVQVTKKQQILPPFLAYFLLKSCKIKSDRTGYSPPVYKLQDKRPLPLFQQAFLSAHNQRGVE